MEGVWTRMNLKVPFTNGTLHVNGLLWLELETMCALLVLLECSIKTTNTTVQHSTPSVACALRPQK